VYREIDVTARNLGPGRRASLSAVARVESLRGVARVDVEFTDAEPFEAAGTASFRRDGAEAPAEAAFEVRGAAGGGGRLWTLRRLTVKQGSLEANAAGTVDARKTPAGLRLAVEVSKAKIEDLIRLAALWGARAPDGLRAEGTVEAQVAVGGTVEKPLFSGRIEAAEARVTSREIREPVKSSRLRIGFTPQTVTVAPFTLETGTTRVRAEGAVREYRSAAPKVTASFTAENARLEELLRIAEAYGAKPEGLEGKGEAGVSVAVEGAGKAFRYSGSGRLRGVTLRSPALPKPVHVEAADLRFAGDRIEFTRLEAGMGTMHVRGTASARNAAAPELRFDFTVDECDVEELSRMGGKQGGASDGEFVKKITAAGTVSAGKLKYGAFVLTSVRARVEMAGGVLKLDPLTSRIFGGEQSGRVTADLGATPAVYQVRAKLVNVEANELLSAATPLKNVLMGPFSGEAELGFRSRPGEDIARSLNGTVRMELGQGRIAGAQVLNEAARIGRFLGYTERREAFTNFVKMSADLNVRDGVATTENLLVDLGGGTLTGAGTMGLADQTLRLRITTMLGKELAQRSFPGQVGGLLNTVLAGPQGEYVIPMLVTGTFGEPRFAPDAERMAALKLQGLAPGGGGVKGILDAVTGKAGAQGEAKPAGGAMQIFDALRGRKAERK
jgi:AsmA protein